MKSQFKKRIETLKPQLLKLGNKGQSVRTLQYILRDLTFYTGSIDGYFGEKTEQAIRQLEKHFGLAEIGQFDAGIWYVLTFWAEPPQPQPFTATVATHAHQRSDPRLLEPFYELIGS